MSRFVPALVVLALAAGCAAPPALGEEEGGSSSNLTRREKNEGKAKPTAPTTTTSDAGTVAPTTDAGTKPTTPAPTPAPAPAPAPEPTPTVAPADDGLPVMVTWNGVANTEASLDVVLNSGQIIGPCVGVDILRDEFQHGSDGLHHDFTGDCPSAGTSPNPADIRAFRICSAYNNDWANATCTESAPWNHTSATVHIDNH